MPWLVCEDFNKILSNDEKYDLGFIGFLFTWKKGGDSNTKCHLIVVWQIVSSGICFEVVRLNIWLLLILIMPQF